MRIDASGVLGQILIWALLILNLVSLCVAIWALSRANPLLQSWVWRIKIAALIFWALVGLTLIAALNRQHWPASLVSGKIAAWVFITAMPAGSLLLAIAFLKMRRMMAAFTLGADAEQSETTTDAVIAISQDGLVMHWSVAAERIFGLTRDEILGNPLDQIMPRRYRKGHSAALNRLKVTEKMTLAGRIIRGFGLRRNGDEFPVEIRLTPWDGDKQGDPAYVGVVRDVSVESRSPIQL
jgi:PAS domain S-box-containing protein